MSKTLVRKAIWCWYNNLYFSVACRKGYFTFIGKPIMNHLMVLLPLEFHPHSDWVAPTWTFLVDMAERRFWSNKHADYLPIIDLCSHFFFFFGQNKLHGQTWHYSLLVNSNTLPGKEMNTKEETISLSSSMDWLLTIIFQCSTLNTEMFKFSSFEYSER